MWLFTEVPFTARLTNRVNLHYTARLSQSHYTTHSTDLYFDVFFTHSFGCMDWSVHRGH